MLIPPVHLTFLLAPPRYYFSCLLFFFLTKSNTCSCSSHLDLLIPLKRSSFLTFCCSGCLCLNCVCIQHKHNLRTFHLTTLCWLKAWALESHWLWILLMWFGQITQSHFQFLHRVAVMIKWGIAHKAFRMVPSAWPLGNIFLYRFLIFLNVNFFSVIEFLTQYILIVPVSI